MAIAKLQLPFFIHFRLQRLLVAGIFTLCHSNDHCVPSVLLCTFTSKMILRQTSLQTEALKTGRTPHAVLLWGHSSLWEIHCNKHNIVTRVEADPTITRYNHSTQQTRSFISSRYSTSFQPSGSCFSERQKLFAMNEKVIYTSIFGLLQKSKEKFCCRKRVCNESDCRHESNCTNVTAIVITIIIIIIIFFLLFIKEK